MWSRKRRRHRGRVRLPAAASAARPSSPPSLRSPRVPAWSSRCGSEAAAVTRPLRDVHDFEFGTSGNARAASVRWCTRRCTPAVVSAHHAVDGRVCSATARRLRWAMRLDLHDEHDTLSRRARSAVRPGRLIANGERLRAPRAPCIVRAVSARAPPAGRMQHPVSKHVRGDLGDCRPASLSSRDRRGRGLKPLRREQV